MKRVLLSLRSASVLGRARTSPAERQLEKLAPRAVLDGPRGAAIRRAAADRAAILDIMTKLPKADRAALPDIEPTVSALMDRVAQLARLLHDIDANPNPALAEQRDVLSRQLDHAGVALGNLRLDLIRFQASGIDLSAGGVSSATQEARALSRHIDTLLEAAAEVRAL